MARRLQLRLSSEDGAITLIVALMLVVFLGITAIVIDLGRQRHARQQLQDAVDSASLAATAYLPAHDATAVGTIDALVKKITVASSTDLQPAAVTTTYLCVIRRDPADPVGGPNNDLGAGVGYACGPNTDGDWNGSAGWSLNQSETRMTHACDPSAGDWCNAVRVTTSQTVKYLFAPAIGFSSGGTGAVSSTACEGACKSTGAPLDVALVLDRTGSMSLAQIAKVKDATKALLGVYDPAQVRVALIALPYPDVNDRCQVQSPQEYNTGATPLFNTWGVVLNPPFSTDYRDGTGALNTSSELVQKVDCLARAGTPTIKVNGNISPSQSHTDLGDPMTVAGNVLMQNGRPGVPDVVIFMTDGQANQPWDPGRGIDQPCEYASSKANTVKTQGVDGQGKAEVFTVGYWSGTENCPDLSGPFAGGGRATDLLANMATQPSSADPPAPGSTCGANENTDGDHYFCSDKNAIDPKNDLTNVFRQIAQQTIKIGRLIDAG